MRLEFKQERDTDFMNTYSAVLENYGKKAPYIKKELLIRETISRPTKRFYVSPEQALRIISQLLRGKEVIFKSTEKEKMYRTILSEVEKRLPSALPLSHLVTEIIYTPAPCFYITLESASILYYKLIKQSAL